MRGARRGRGGRASYVRDSTLQETPEIYKPRPQYPTIIIPRRPPVSPAEQACVEHFRRFRKQMRDGPYFTVLDVKLPLRKPGELGASHSSLSGKPAQLKAGHNPFDMQTYSKKFSRPRRTMPILNQRKYVTHLFPAELLPLIDPSTSVHMKEGAQKSAKAARHQMNADDQELEKEADEEEELVEEEQDDDFEEDEGDDDDYNAEQYFDNGEDDAMEDEGGGDFD